MRTAEERKSKANVYTVETPCKKCAGTLRRRHNRECYSCHLSSQRRRYAENREREIARSSAYNREHRQEVAARSRIWFANNPEKVAEYALRHSPKKKISAALYARLNAPRIKLRKARHQKQHPEKYAAAAARRRSRKSGATPDWLTKNQQDIIAYFYWQARVRRLSTGQPHEVDHIVPLKSKRVCGLHVDWNLQVLTAEANAVKGNRLLPQDQLVDYSARGYIGTELEP